MTYNELRNNIKTKLFTDDELNDLYDDYSERVIAIQDDIIKNDPHLKSAEYRELKDHRLDLERKINLIDKFWQNEPF